MDKKLFFEKIENEFLEKLSIKCPDEKKEKFFIFMNELLKKNEVMNLTAITDEEMVIVKHFVDSLELLKIDTVKKAMDIGNFSIIDVGTGAGFPGIPLAIMCENIDFFLIDSLQKRINFINEVVAKMGLTNVKTAHFRADEAANLPKYREKFDVAVARGVSKINVLAEYMLPFVRTDGNMVLYKMDDCEAELSEGKNAINKLGGKFKNKISYKLLNDEPQRCLIICDKIKNSPKNYPRPGNKPQKEPII